MMLRAVALVSVLFSAPYASASDPLVPDDPGEGWRLRITPYLWVPAQDGDVTVKGIRAPVDLDVGDTFDAVTDHFNFGITIHAELQRGAFTVFGDAMYLSLKTDGVPMQGTTGTVRQDTGVFELGIAYRVIDLPRTPGSIGFALEPLVGARAHYLSLEVDPRGGSSDSGDEFWVDAIVGLRASIGLNDAVSLRLRGDIGAGGSDLTWSALGGIGITLTPCASLELGYKALGTDYSTGSGADRFEYDVLLHGPYIGFILIF